MQYSMGDIQRYVQRFYGTSRLYITPFGIPVPFLSSIGALGQAGATQRQTINIQANADFLLTGVSHYFPQDPGQSYLDKTVGSITVDFRESGSKEPFTDSPVMLENYSYNGINERDRDFLRFLAGGTNVTVDIANVGDQTFSDGLMIMLNGFLVRVFN